MPIVYQGVAGHIAVSANANEVVNLEMDIPVGWLLVIVAAQGAGSTSNPFGSPTDLWHNQTSAVYIYDVTDTGANAWGYAMDESLAFCGRLPMTLVTTPMVSGVDTVTVDIEGDRENPVYGVNLVGRILAFSGVTAFVPNSGLPVALNYPIFSVPYNPAFGGFFTLNPADAIPLPRFVVDGGVAHVTGTAFDWTSQPTYVSSEFEYGQDAGVQGETLLISTICWDGTVTPWDYYYVTGAADPSPGFVVAPSPSPYGLSADDGTWDFAAVNPDEGWIDLGNDSNGVLYQSRYSYLIRPVPPVVSGGPNFTQIKGTYDAAGGSWGDDAVQTADASFPYAPGTWTPPPHYPLGDPNSITSPVFPQTWHMEGIAAGDTAAFPGIFASVGGDTGVSSTGTMGPDDVGISSVHVRVANLGAS